VVACRPSTTRQINQGLGAQLFHSCTLAPLGMKTYAPWRASRCCALASRAPSKFKLARFARARARPAMNCSLRSHFISISISCSHH
jgi:hypothetical protein